MNFTTIEFDCNTPTTQQINVPTNTDYKVGIKVKKDGEVVNISPENVTVGEYELDADKTNGYVTYKASTGDDASFTQLDVKIDKTPTVVKSIDRTIPNGAGTISIVINETVLSAYFGQKVYSDAVRFEYSTDDGASWKSATESTKLVPFSITSGPYTPLYGLGNPELGDHKWHPFVEGQWDLNTSYDYVELPEDPVLKIKFTGNMSTLIGGPTEFPCIGRLVVPIGEDIEIH